MLLFDIISRGSPRSRRALPRIEEGNSTAAQRVMPHVRRRGEFCNTRRFDFIGTSGIDNNSAQRPFHVGVAGDRAAANACAIQVTRMHARPPPL